jgi:pimeloyl-ACP methyl ester carboxylesterase
MLPSFLHFFQFHFNEILGLAENWRVWKDIMLPFCDKYRPIAIDIEGMGQSLWPSIDTDLPPDGDSRDFMGDMELQLLDELGLSCVLFLFICSLSAILRDYIIFF